MRKRRGLTSMSIEDSYGNKKSVTEWTVHTYDNKEISFLTLEDGGTVKIVVYKSVIDPRDTSSCISFEEDMSYHIDEE